MQEQHSILEILISNFLAWAAPLTAFLLALIRTKKAGKVDLLEALMCALLTFAAWGGLEWLHFPQAMAVLIGGFIGGLGSTWARDWMRNRADKSD
jgi:lambda family phage holin